MTATALPRIDMRTSRAIHERRTVRTFEDRAIADEPLERIIDAARWAPSAGNEQPVRLIVLRRDPDRDTLRGLQAIAWESKRVSSYWVAMFRPSGVREYVQDLQTTPLAIGVVADPERSGAHAGDRDGHVIAAAMAIQNMKLQVHAEGLGAVLYTHWIEEKAKMLLDVPRTWSFVGLLCLGVPVHIDSKERRAALHRKSLRQLAFIDRFGAAHAWPQPAAPREELDVVESIRRRRSIRVFGDEPVDDATVALLLEAARWAPSAGNFQPWRFVVVRERERREQLQRAADLAVEANPGLGLRGEPRVDLLRAPLVIAITADPHKIGPHVHGEMTHLIGASLAAQNLWLQAAAIGLGAVLVRQLVHDVARAALSVPADEDLVGVMALGAPAEAPEAPARVAVADLAREHGFDGHAGEDPGIAPLPAVWRSERGIFEDGRRE